MLLPSLHPFLYFSRIIFGLQASLAYCSEYSAASCCSEDFDHRLQISRHPFPPSCASCEEIYRQLACAIHCDPHQSRFILPRSSCMCTLLLSSVVFMSRLLVCFLAFGPTPKNNRIALCHPLCDAFFSSCSNSSSVPELALESARSFCTASSPFPLVGIVVRASHCLMLPALSRSFCPPALVPPPPLPVQPPPPAPPPPSLTSASSSEGFTSVNSNSNGNGEEQHLPPQKTPAASPVMLENEKLRQRRTASASAPLAPILSVPLVPAVVAAPSSAVAAAPLSVSNPDIDQPFSGLELIIGSFSVGGVLAVILFYFCSRAESSVKKSTPSSSSSTKKQQQQQQQPLCGDGSREESFNLNLNADWLIPPVSSSAWSSSLSASSSALLQTASSPQGNSDLPPSVLPVASAASLNESDDSRLPPARFLPMTVPLASASNLAISSTSCVPSYSAVPSFAPSSCLSSSSPSSSFQSSSDSSLPHRHADADLFVAQPFCNDNNNHSCSSNHLSIMNPCLHSPLLLSSIS